MFSKNDLRPAYAAASKSSSQPTPQKATAAPLVFDTEETGDFHGFNQGNSRTDMPRRRPEGAGRRPAPAKKGPNKKALFLAAAAAIAVVAILVVVLVLVLTARAKDIKYENNTYLVYNDDKGAYHVLVNGDDLDEKFQGEVTLFPSADRSFAYVFDQSSDGVQAYILEGKKLSKVTPGRVAQILSYASLDPGVIYLRDGSYYVWSEKGGDQQFIKQSKNPEKFILSGDASTVLYTADKEKGDAVYEYLYVFADGVTTELARNYIPAALSNEGDYIYAYTVNTERDTKELYYIDPDDKENPVKIKTSASFCDDVTPVLNVKGDEILFYTTNGSEFKTLLYRAKKNKTYTIGSGVLVPAEVDPKVAVPGEFAETYLTQVQLTDSKSLSTYFITKKYEGDEICKFAGKFSPDGDYFYYVNNDDSLMQLDLKKDERRKINHEDIIDFVITAKGNLYTLDDSKQLRFYKVSTGKTTPVSYDTTDISLYTYSNHIYFAEEETENVNVWISEEGSEKEKVKMDKIQITRTPTFTNPTAKKTYAYYYDATAGWQLYYTGNGKSFDLITDSGSNIIINGSPVDHN